MLRVTKLHLLAIHRIPLSNPPLFSRFHPYVCLFVMRQLRTLVKPHPHVHQRLGFQRMPQYTREVQSQMQGMSLRPLALTLQSPVIGTVMYMIAPAAIKVVVIAVASPVLVGSLTAETIVFTAQNAEKLNISEETMMYNPNVFPREATATMETDYKSPMVSSRNIGTMDTTVYHSLFPQIC